MIIFSSKTAVNRRFTLRELFRQINPDKAVKDDSKVITSIVLSNVLSNDTMNFNERGKVKEIYIFDITLSEKRIPSLFITALDKAINLNTLFVFTCDGETCLYGAYKEKTEKSVKLSKYYQTEWMKSQSKTTIPLSVRSLDDVYTFLIDELIPIEARESETTEGFVARYEQILKIKKDIDKLQKLVDSEKQPKIRFELNDQLKVLKKQLEELR